jgi:hypothetical protein
MSTFKKNATLRFVTLYVFSLLLIFIVVTGFWQKGLGPKQPAIQQSSGSSEYFMQFDTLLHTKLDQLDNLYASYLNNLENGTADATNFLSVRNELSTTLDSIANQASFLTNGSKKETMEMIVSRFRPSLEIKNRLINELTYLPRNTALTKVQGVTIDQSYAKTEIERLKNTLAEKEQAINLLEQKLQQQPGTDGTVTNAPTQKELADKNNLIASLQTQIKQKDAALQRASQTNSNGSGDEWKPKYSSLKASYDKLADSEKALKNAYKTVIDDNKRLIGQLQSKKE